MFGSSLKLDENGFRDATPHETELLKLRISSLDGVVPMKRDGDAEVGLKFEQYGISAYVHRIGEKVGSREFRIVDSYVYGDKPARVLPGVWLDMLMDFLHRRKVQREVDRLKAKTDQANAMNEFAEIARGG